MNENEAILEWVDEVGGGSVWEPEIFAVTLIDVPLTDDDVLKLCGLSGVTQIAINSEGLSYITIKALASIPGLRSLVLNRPSVSESEVVDLRKVGPEIEVISE